jgi:hypothetical protein
VPLAPLREGESLEASSARNVRINVDFAWFLRIRTSRVKNAHCAKVLILPRFSHVRPGRNVRLLSCHRSVGGKRPGLAHLFGGAPANDIGFLRAWEDLRWGQDTSSTKHDGPGGQLTWTRGVEAVSLARNIAGSIG